MKCFPLAFVFCLLLIPVAILLILGGIQTKDDGEVTAPVGIAMSLIAIGAIVSAGLVVVKVHHRMAPQGGASFAKFFVSILAIVLVIALYLTLTIGVLFAGCTI